jgi:phospholipase C
MRCFFIFILTLSYTFSIAQDRDTISIMTWNIYMLPRPFVHVNQSQRADSIVALMNKEDIDIVVFQEVFDRKAKKKLRSGLAQKFPYHAGPGYSPLLKQSSGVMIFSKFPIYYDEFLPFKECEDIDCWAKKGALYVEIFVNNKKKLQVIGTHMQSKTGFLYNYTRNQQLKSLYKMSKLNKEEGVPVIYAGDFNISESDSLYEGMIALFKAGKMNLWGKEKCSIGSDNDLRLAENGPECDEDLIDYILLDENKTGAYIVNTEIITI